MTWWEEAARQEAEAETRWRQVSEEALRGSRAAGYRLQMRLAWVRLVLNKEVGRDVVAASERRLGLRKRR